MEMTQEHVEMEKLINKEDEGRQPTLPNKKETLIAVIQRGNIGKITQELTPKALTKCDNNALLTAMEANFELRRLADETGPSRDEFRNLANSVDEFSYCLLDPLKSDMEARHVFGCSLDDLMAAGIDWEQKKFFTHPVLFDLMTSKWLGRFGRMKTTPWHKMHRWMWIFLNIWCLFDLVMFPFLFAVFYLKHLMNRRKRKDKGIKVGFLINATSKIADDAFSLMKRSIKQLIDKYGDKNAKYQIIIHGNDSTPKEISADSVPGLEKGTADTPALHDDLGKAYNSTLAEEGQKVIIFFTDHKTSLKHERQLVEDKVRTMTMKNIKLIPVAIGAYVNIRELKKITQDIRLHPDHAIVHFGECEKPETVSKRIWHELQGKDMFENYLEYFTTPYFIFVRDTLSYFTLLGLHFTLCLQPSTIRFSSLEWAILVFFMGRFLMESKQFLQEGRESVKNVGENEREGEQRRDQISRSTICAKKCGKYLRDRWNILDSITLVIFLITFLLRTVTWATSSSVTNNRALVIAGYLYGLNTMFLTLRAFGHVMETIKGVGTIQIALFHIIGDVATIFWQFVTAILAFSIAITKVYMAEKSYISKEIFKDDLACKTSGIHCWWATVRHLTWSLLGIAELDPLESVDTPSVAVAEFLFGIFLIMGVILLVNMMIALLSNTYQQVEDNALREWSFKNAVTIQTFSAYHPIPVPLNLISNICVGLYRLYHKCMACRKGEDHSDADNANCVKSRNNSLDAVVEYLQHTYFQQYGSSFPLTDDSKMDQVIKVTERNREMINQVADRTFTNHSFDQGMLPSGPMAWDTKGIRVEGCLLACEGGMYCTKCRGESGECHGARYRMPLSPEFPHFEVLIQETEQNSRFLGVGVVWKGYGNHAMPGCRQGTVGYLADESKIFGPFEPVSPKGKEYEEAFSYRGDLIGCTVEFDSQKDGKVPVIFTINGKQITQDKILIEYKPSERSLYPYIAMGDKGIRVLAKICSSPNDNVEIIGKIKATTESVASEMTSKLDKVDAVVRKMDGELKEAHREQETLVEKIFKDLEHFEQLIEDPDQMELDRGLHYLEDFIAMDDQSDEPVKRVRRVQVSEALIMREITHVCNEDGPGLEDQQQQGPHPLKMAQENLEKLAQITDERFTKVLKSLEEAEEEAKENTQYQKENNKRLQLRFEHVQESLKDFIRAHRGQSPGVKLPVISSYKIKLK